MPDTNQQILEKAIQKAIDNHWHPAPLIRVVGNQVEFVGDLTVTSEDFATVIFNHDFAKALWGEEIKSPFIKWKLERREPLKNWEYHLMQLVLQEDPIKYLGEHL